jgi:hypothetical protein
MTSEQSSVFLSFGIALVGAIYTPAHFGMAWFDKSLSSTNLAIKNGHKLTLTDKKQGVNDMIVDVLETGNYPRNRGDYTLFLSYQQCLQLFERAAKVTLL